MLFRMHIAFALLLILVAPIVHAQSAENPYYPIVKLPNSSNAIALVDHIDVRTPLVLERVIAENPGINEILLNSGGGNVFSGLSIASRVHQLGLKTTIPPDSKCFSACSFIFFAGKQRQAYGELGVHQIASSNGRGDLVKGQYAIADILDVLNRFDVHPNIFAVMFRTPPEDMYVFSPEEIALYGFNEDTPRSRNVESKSDQFILEPIPSSKSESWFVVAGSYPRIDLTGAQKREQELRNRGLAVTLIDTNEYSNFANGLYAVVVGPTKKPAAQINLETVREYVSDAYIKTGIR